MTKTITKAMILAAGFGTRLKPVTNYVPKALVKVNGIPMIETVIKHLAKYGINEIAVNAHYMPELIERYFKENDFGVKIVIFHEKEILGTGGGIKNASLFFKDTDSFIVHNVDVMSEINLNELVNFHIQNQSLASLAVKKRKTSRPLIIDSEGNITGRKSPEKYFRYRESAGSEYLAGFCGIHVIKTEIFENLKETGFFDIFTSYFRLISKNQKILAFDCGDTGWSDLGTLDKNIHSV
jgi:NDP-sugar pyrophosphorylase family protein